jgi:chemotaxis protein histidine kinase CheA
VAVPLESVTRVETAPPGKTTVCLARGDGTEARVVVDEVLGRREIVVQPLPPQARAEGYSGAALLEDGEIALVLDPGALVP